MNSDKSLTYKDAGVDIDAGNALVERIKPIVKSTHRDGVMGSLGGFGGLFELDLEKYRRPVMVSGTDGVGTKLKLAIELDRYDTIGIDLVAMCVNDIIVLGAEPLFFLDYYATAKLDIEIGAAIIEGIAEGCRQSGAALIGGETAELPGLYADRDFDLAGFCVGAVERENILTGEGVEEGDILLGLASSGIHSNGFSLVRRLVEDSGIGYNDPCPFDDSKDFGTALLEPTRIYVRSTLEALKARHIKAISHITGGGFVENIPRILPKTASAHVDASCWTLPAVFDWLRAAGNIEPHEMAKTFNCGIGLVVIVKADGAAETRKIFEQNGETVYTLGHVVKRKENEPATVVTGTKGSWGYDAPWQAISSH